MAQSTAVVNLEGSVKSLQPSSGRVIVKPDLAESKFIIIPTTAKERQMATTGVLVAIGEPVDSLPFQLGDRVVFSRYAGIGITIKEGEKETMFLVMTHQDIVCKIEEHNPPPKAEEFQ